MPFRKYPEGLRQEAIDRLKNGEKYADVALALGVSKAYLHGVAKHNGLARRHSVWPALQIPTDPIEFGYLVGLFEGEGNIHFTGRYWSVNIANTDRAVLDWLESLGGRVYRVHGGVNKTCYAWRMGKAQDVNALLKAMLPHMRMAHRIEKAKEAIAGTERLTLERAAKRGLDAKA